MTTQQIFDYFQIPPGLQQHMYTVAGVGKYICDHWVGEPIKTHETVAALLIHDLGNLIKFDLSPGATIYDPVLNSEEWHFIQRKMVEKYGPDAHLATYKMAQEVTANQLILELINSMDATNLTATLNKSWEEKICEYADLRVTPIGITSLNDRLDDIHQRYQQHRGAWADEKLLATNKQAGKEIENQLQQHISQDILTIPTKKIATYLVELAGYQI
ncbi:MAG: hypothetical protein IT416_02215 [Candidatus Pacebacteria bacterium]|nr:hypothetical protein [Candidatus Paceibacterota bacterium]